MFIPTSVFISTIGINIQTMVCHGSMITVGVFLMYTQYVKVEHRTILWAIPVFSIAVVIAMGFNWLAHNTAIMGDSLLNAFYICPQCDPHLPVYSLVQPLLPAGLDELVYIAGFTLASYLILLAAMGIKRLATKKSAAAVG